MQGIIVALSASAVSFAVLYLLLTRKVRTLLDPESILAQIRREVGELIVELNHTTERNISLMEEKLKAVTGTLGEAEKRLAVLRREAAALEQTERAYAALRPPPVVSGEAVAAEARLPAGAGFEGPREGDVRAMVVELHRAGISAESIARRLELPRAKVELIVSLEEGAP